MARGKVLEKRIPYLGMNDRYDMRITDLDYLTNKQLKEYIRKGREFVEEDLQSAFEPVSKSAEYVTNKNISDKMSGYNKSKLLNQAKLIRAHLNVSRYATEDVPDIDITEELLKSINKDSIDYQLTSEDYSQLRKYFAVVRDIIEEYGSMELKNMFTEMKSRDIENPTLAHVTIDVYYKNKGKELIRDELVKLLKKEILG